MFNLLREFDDKYESVLLVGHNPGLEELLRILTREAKTMPTATLSKIILNIEHWTEIAMNISNLDFIIRPKEEMKKLSAAD